MNVKYEINRNGVAMEADCSSLLIGKNVAVEFPLCSVLY